MSYICPACKQAISRIGFDLHLQRSTNQRCKDLYARIYGVLSSDDESAPEDKAEEAHIDVETAGDFFGNYEDYEAEEWGMDIDEDVPERSGTMTMVDEDTIQDTTPIGAIAPTSDATPIGDEDIIVPDKGDGDISEEEANADLEEANDLKEDANNADLEENFTEEQRLGSNEVIPENGQDGTPPPEPLSQPAHPTLPSRSENQQKLFTIKYGSGAGVLLKTSNYSGNAKYAKSFKGVSNKFHPLNSLLEWKLAMWAKFSKISSNALTDLLHIEGIVEKLDLSFSSAKELNALIDQLPNRPKFEMDEIEVGGELHEVYFRDVNECIMALFGDPTFAPYMAFAPELHFLDDAHQKRAFHDMNTGNWWWATQVQVQADCGEGRTIVPILISTDKTQLTLFRNKAAYPVYMTLGNIPKEIRRKPSSRAYILLGYLPTAKLDQIPEASRRRALANLYHACMHRILAPLAKPGREGTKLRCGNGSLYHCHPILAGFCGDYPEQVLVTCTMTGDCPQCPTKRDDLGEIDLPEGLRDVSTMLDLISDPNTTLTEFHKHRVKPVFEPFWKDLPYVHIYRSVVPDILHQLYQGVMKHLVSWIISACSAGEIDARCRRLPPNHNTHLFMKGISGLSRVTGQEHKQMCQILLGLVIGVSLPDGQSPARLLRAVRALLDFLYLAKCALHTQETLDRLDDALTRFHNNKDIFIDLGIRTNFNFPKLHFCRHYARSIQLFGTPDNFSTSYTEHLHIDLAKDAYRASNRKDETPQMTTWLVRKEKLSRHAQYIIWQQDGCPQQPESIWTPPALSQSGTLTLTKHPSVRSVSIEHLQDAYGATHFIPALARYVLLKNEPTISRAQLEWRIENLHIPFRHVPVWHKVKYISTDAFTEKSDTIDAIHARPAREDNRGRPVPSRFDTALIRHDYNSNTPELKAHRVAQVRVIFSLPQSAIENLFHPNMQVQHLAYVEWFSPFPRAPERDHGLYKVSRSISGDGSRLVSIVPVESLVRSIHLFPSFGTTAPANWTSSQVLDQCTTFFINTFTDHNMYSKFT